MNWYAGAAARRLPLLTLWSLRDDVVLETGAADGSALLLTRWGEMPVADADPVVLEFLQRMRLGPVSLDNVVAAAADRRRLTALLDALQCVVIRSVGPADGGGPLLSVIPTTQRSAFQPVPFPEGGVARLSRMALMRGEHGDLLLESPLAVHRVLLHRPAARALVAALAGPSGLDTLAATTGMPAEWVAQTVGCLLGTGIVVLAEATSPPVFAEDDDPVLLPWTPHELLFHARTRAGRGDHAPREGLPPPESVLKPPAAGPRFPLFRPRFADLLVRDPPLTVALEARRSDRRFGTAPVPADQVGELLYRTARLRALRPPDGSDRPYPSTGGLHELELYVVADRSGEVPPGIHHYDPHDHQLVLVGDEAQVVDGLLEGTRIAGGLTRRPALLVEVTARFHRMSEVFQGGAYATTLRHVGALLQSMYLVATAMGLASCAVPPRDDDPYTSDALGLDWRTEATVGGFVFGQPAGAPVDGPGEVPVNDADWPRLSRDRLRPSLPHRRRSKYAPRKT